MRRPILASLLIRAGRFARLERSLAELAPERAAVERELG
jgi:hypothetical protein